MNMILKRQMELKKKGKKGFTLIEVIVVIVIIAILAAIAIPALTGYIDKANQRSAISEARTVQIGLQAIGSDLYGSGTLMSAATPPVTSGAGNLPSEYSSLGGATTVGDEIRFLSGGNIPANDSDVTSITWNKNTLTAFEYESTGGFTVNWTAAGGYVVS